jgi:septum formation protein
VRVKSVDTIILASGSPRRHDLLARVKIPFKVISPNLSEDFSPHDSIEDIVAGIARKKVETVLELFKAESPRWVLGADTVVEVDGKVLGKPGGPEEAESMLKRLSGAVHRVFTGLALCVEKNRALEIESVCTQVKFRAMDPEEIHFYVESGEWTGAAGAYRIQERGSFFIEWIKGSYSNVVGLPLEAFYGMLKRNSFKF